MATTDNKAIAKDFLTLIVNGHIDEAYDQYVDLSGKHHNVFSPAGMPALKQGMKDNDDKFPAKQLVIKQVVAEGDTVVCHSRLILKAGEPGLMAVHVLRFKDDKIVELWDCAQAIPAKQINSDGPF